MSEQPPGRELGMATLQFLTRSRNRFRVLCRLSEEPSSAGDLQRDLGVARTTLRRLLNELDDRGWIFRVGTDYHAALPAHLTVASVQQTVDELGAASRLTEFFETIPAKSRRRDFADFPVEEVLERVEEVSVVVPTTAEPYRPQSEVESLLSSAGSVRGFLPSASPVFEAAFQIEGSEIIIPSKASGSLPAELRQAGIDQDEEHGPIRVLVTETDVTYGLLLLDETVVLIGFDEYGRPQSVVVFPEGTESVVGWGEVVYDRVREHAVPLEGDGDADSPED